MAETQSATHKMTPAKPHTPYLIFNIGQKEFGIENGIVREITHPRRITVLPGQPPAIRGIFNLRENIVPALDVRRRLGLPALKNDEYAVIIVVHLQDTTVGLLVDKVSEVLDLSPENIAVLPQTTHKSGSRFIRGLGKTTGGLKILLDAEKLLFDATGSGTND